MQILRCWTIFSDSGFTQRFLPRSLLIRLPVGLDCRGGITSLRMNMCAGSHGQPIGRRVEHIPYQTRSREFASGQGGLHPQEISVKF